MMIKWQIGLFIFIMSVFLKPNINAQEDVEKEYSLFKSKTYVKNPMDLRDPFKRRISKKKAQQKSRNTIDGIYTNANTSIENKPIESLRVIGVMIGAERRAMVMVAGEGSDKVPGEIYYIKEGMKLGPSGAEVKAILPGGVVLVERIRNVYDQDEYLETVIPVSD
jgi:type IV pilus assembly protein PilP